MAAFPQEPAAHEPSPPVELTRVAARPGLEEVVGRLQSAHRRRAFAEMRSCFHDEARIESVAAREVLGPDETVIAVRDAFDDGVYSMGELSIEPLRGPNAVLAWGGVRHRVAGDPPRISDSTVYWLTTGRDGLMWRVRIFPTRGAATAHLDRFGETLGL